MVLHRQGDPLTRLHRDRVELDTLLGPERSQQNPQGCCAGRVDWRNTERFVSHASHTAEADRISVSDEVHDNV